MTALLSLSLLAGTFGVMPIANAHGPHLCKPVFVACKAAGKKGQDVRACVKTIREGGTVEGVTVDPKDLSECQAGMKPPETK